MLCGMGDNLMPSLARAVLACITVLALATMAAAQVQPKPSLNADAMSRFPPPGQLVDVGGRRLHVDCRGPSRGPTVILETGALASSLYYQRARDEIARSTRVCLYDRAGLGWSDPAPYPRSFADRADDLHTLLSKAKIRGPYILVGHSMGGLIVREFVARHPKGVIGVVLIESSEPAFNGSDANVARVKASVPQLALAVSAAQAGIDIPQLKAPGAPPEELVALRASVFRAGQDDMVAMSNVKSELGSLDSLGDLPLIVIRRGKPDAGMSPAENAGWIDAQGRNAKLSSRSVLLVAERSGHNVHTDQPELYAEAVKQVLALNRRR
jgi:pimeloyl-ACP methyl ester carboxylesterase